MGVERAQLEWVKRLIDSRLFEAMRLIDERGLLPSALYYLGKDVLASVGDLTWGEFVTHYEATPVAGLFLDGASISKDETERDLNRDKAVIVLSAQTVDDNGLVFLKPDGGVDQSGRFLSAERFPMNYQILDMEVRRIAGRPYRYVFRVQEVFGFDRIQTDPTKPTLGTAPKPDGGSPW